MAEFVDVMKQFNRMYKACQQGASVPVEASYANAVKKPDLFEEVVMSWAAEHPEPVYPTWREYLTSIGVIPKAEILPTERNEFVYSDFSEAFALTNTRIDADLAQKLGIEPKEDEP